MRSPGVVAGRGLWGSVVVVEMVVVMVVGVLG